MSTWAERFAAMSHEDRLQTIAEDPSTLDALIAEAAPPAPTPRRHCLGDVCDLAKSTGIACAHEECDIDLGARLAAPAPTGDNDV